MAYFINNLLSTESVKKRCSKSTAKLLFPEYEIELEPEEHEASREKTEDEVMKEYEELLRSGQVTHQDDDGEYNVLLPLAEGDKLLYMRGEKMSEKNKLFQSDLRTEKLVRNSAPNNMAWQVFLGHHQS